MDMGASKGPQTPRGAVSAMAVRTRRWTRQEYERLIDRGVFGETLLRSTPQGPDGSTGRSTRSGVARASRLSLRRGPASPSPTFFRRGPDAASQPRRWAIDGTWAAQGWTASNAAAARSWSEAFSQQVQIGATYQVGFGDAKRG